MVKCQELGSSDNFVLAFRPDAVVEFVKFFNSRQDLFHLEKSECKITALLSHVFSRYAEEKVKIALKSEDTWKFKEENI